MRRWLNLLPGATRHALLPRFDALAPRPYDMSLGDIEVLVTWKGVPRRSLGVSALYKSSIAVS